MRRCGWCRREGHDRRSCPDHDPTLPRDAHRPDHDPFGAYSTATDPLKEAEARLQELGETELAQQTRALFYATSRAYWARWRAISAAASGRKPAPSK